MGAGAGVALAFLFHRLDRTARESADVELALGTNVLASIPPFGFGHRGGSQAVVMLAGGRSARTQQARESFRRLRSSLQFLGSSRDASTFLITSARPTEGKSTMAANLAVAIAQGGARVCIVNADLRRPTLEKILGVRNQRGIAEWLVDPTITDIMVPVAATPGLVLVPAGTPPPNPGELLATGRIGELIEELSAQFDIVIVDAPPVLSAADASSISPSVDGTVIVVDASRTDTDALLRVRSEINRAGGVVLGAILNRDRSDTGLRLRKDHYAYEKVSASRATQ
jgi:capsular exopolysaccharide synthesis family protein